MPSKPGFLSAPVAMLAAGALFCGQAFAASDVETSQDVDPVTDEVAVLDQIVVVAHKDKRSIRNVAANVTVLFDFDGSAFYARGELFEPPGHVVFDLYYSQRVGERMTLRTGLHNLTDRTYWNWSDVRGLSPDDPLLPFMAQAGRSASVSLNLDW